jgi:hypothetical protein
MNRHKLARTCTNWCKFAWICLEFLEFPWICKLAWICMNVHENGWLCMTLEESMSSRFYLDASDLLYILRNPNSTTYVFMYFMNLWFSFWHSASSSKKHNISLFPYNFPTYLVLQDPYSKHVKKITIHCKRNHQNYKNIVQRGSFQ